MEHNRVTEDLGTKAGEAEDAESYEEENPETSSGFARADHLVGYTIHFANAVELFQKKSQNCFGCGSPDHLVKDCPKDLSKTARKVHLNTKEGMTKKGGWTPSETSSHSTGILG